MIVEVPLDNLLKALLDQERNTLVIRGIECDQLGANVEPAVAVGMLTAGICHVITGFADGPAQADVYVDGVTRELKKFMTDFAEKLAASKAIEAPKAGP